MLVSSIHHRQTAVGIYVSLPSWISRPSPTLSQPSRLSQTTGLNFRRHKGNSHWLPTLHMVMYMFQSYSLNLSTLFFFFFFLSFLLLCEQVCSLCLSLYCCPTNRFISAIFLESICINIQYLFFSDLLHSIKQAPDSSTSLELTQNNSLLWLSNIA